MSDKKYFHPDADFARKLDISPPSVETHGTTDDIRKNLKPVKMEKWRLEGNMLIAQTELGEVVNYLPPEYIMTGVDKVGKPILQKINT